jgi:hypothetical protein
MDEAYPGFNPDHGDVQAGISQMSVELVVRDFARLSGTGIGRPPRLRVKEKTA